jgi:hypothetical protein
VLADLRHRRGNLALHFLGSIVGTAAFPPARVVHETPAPTDCLGAAGGALIIIAMHHANIRRLLTGTENKVGKEGKSGSQESRGPELVE